MQHECRVEIIESISGLADLAKPWNELLVGSQSNTIFLTWEWLYTWAECFLDSSRRLFVILIYKEGEVIGIAPWCIRHRTLFGLSLKQIEFLGTPESGSDYVDVIARKGKEKEVAQALYRFLAERRDRWDGISWDSVSADSLFLLYMTREIEKAGKHVEVRLGELCPSISLPSSVQAFRAQLSANRRQQFARHLRLLGKEGEVRHLVYKGAEVPEVLPEFSKIYAQRWGQSTRLFQFVVSLIARLDGQDVVQLDLLKVGERNVAGLLHFQYGGRLSMYLMGVDHTFEKGISIGNIIVGLTVDRAITAGLTSYDFLKGTEDYKFHWSNTGTREVSLYVYGKKLAPFVWMAGRCLKACAKVVVR